MLLPAAWIFCPWAFACWYITAKLRPNAVMNSWQAAFPNPVFAVPEFPKPTLPVPELNKPTFPVPEFPKPMFPLPEFSPPMPI